MNVGGFCCLQNIWEHSPPLQQLHQLDTCELCAGILRHNGGRQVVATVHQRAMARQVSPSTSPPPPPVQSRNKQKPGDLNLVNKSAASIRRLIGPGCSFMAVIWNMGGECIKIKNGTTKKCIHHNNNDLTFALESLNV